MVARLCSVSHVVKFLPVSPIIIISGLAVEAVDLINCSWSVFGFVFSLTSVSKRRKVKMGLCATQML